MQQAKASSSRSCKAKSEQAAEEIYGQKCCCGGQGGCSAACQF